MRTIYAVAISFLAFTYSQGQTVSKVMVSGLGGSYVSHDQSVESAFRMGYSSYDGTQFSGTVTQYVDKYTSLSSSFSYANTNGYQIIIRSYVGISAASKTALNYPGIKAFLPAGSNSYTYVYTGDVSSSPVVITGAGTDSCVTGYSIEFFSVDPVSGGNMSSFSNGYIAGQIAFIANRLGYTVEQARQLARQYATNHGRLDMHNGYGKITVYSTVTLPALPVELSSFTAKPDGRKVKLLWRTETEQNNYGFEIQKINHQNSGEILWDDVAFVAGKGNSNSPVEYSYIANPDFGRNVYRLKQIDMDGKDTYSDTVSVVVRQEKSPVLMQNKPNPFNPSTEIKFSIPEKAFISLKVYDILGRESGHLVQVRE